MNPVHALQAWFRRRREKVSTVRTPTVLQMEAVECGAASLSMILAYYGRWIPLEKLRSDCGVSRDGSKASNILKAAASHGLKAKGFKKEIPQLEQMKPPFIVFWNFNHYVVVDGFGHKEVMINDPGAGRKPVTNEEFNESYTGVVLTFAPTSTFEKAGEAPNTWKSLRARMHGTAKPLTFLTLASLLAIIPGMANAAYARIFVDSILMQGRWSWLHPLILAMTLTTALMLVLGVLTGWVTATLQTKLAIGQSAKYFWHVLRLPMDFFSQRYSGEIGARVHLNDNVASLIATQLTGAVLNVIMIVFYAAVMFKYDVVLTLIGIAFSLCNIYALYYVANTRQRLGRRLLQAEAKLSTTSMIGLQSIETIKASGGESGFFARWAGQQAMLVKEEQELATSSLFLSSIPVLLSALNAALLLCLGGLRVMDGVLTIGMLVTLQSLMGSFSAPVWGLMAIGSDAHMMGNQLVRLDDVLDNETDPLAWSNDPGEEVRSQTNTDKLTGQLDIENLSFGYSPLEPPLVSGVSLSIKPGQRVALVGSSGSGKSTIAKLVTGLERPWGGVIRFDGKLRTGHNRVVLCNSVGNVDQNIVLFQGKIRDNITMWDDTIDDARVVQAAKDASIHDFITSLHGDYDYVVQEGGRNFSGGQRQRLEIARALILNPSLLVLDEATSALDPITERDVMNSFRRRGCACLIVAHRLSAIRDADEIIVLEKGKIVQRGTHDSMLALGGPYAELMATEHATEAVTA